MRPMSLTAAGTLTLLLVGCGFDSSSTGPDESGADFPEPQFAVPEAEVVTAAATTNAWTTKAPMPTARHALVVAVVNGLIYAVSGNAGSTKLTTVLTRWPTRNVPPPTFTS